MIICLYICIKRDQGLQHRSVFIFSSCFGQRAWAAEIAERAVRIWNYAFFYNSSIHVHLEEWRKSFSVFLETLVSRHITMKNKKQPVTLLMYPSIIKDSPEDSWNLHINQFHEQLAIKLVFAQILIYPNHEIAHCLHSQNRYKISYFWNLSFQAFHFAYLYEKIIITSGSSQNIFQVINLSHKFV